MRAIICPSRNRPSSSAACARSSPAEMLSPQIGHRNSFAFSGRSLRLKRLQRCSFQILTLLVMRYRSWSIQETLRLTQEARSSDGSVITDAYAYDLVGNRKTKTAGAVTTTYDYNANDQLTNEVVGAGVSTTVYLYDANGSLTNKVTTGVNAVAYAYEYNVQNQLSSVAVDGGTATMYLYNHAGIRVRAGTKYFLTDPMNHTGYAQVLEEGTIVGSPTMSYTIGDDVLSQTDSGFTTRNLLADGHGSTRQLVSGTTTVSVSQQYNYDAYGVGLGTPANPLTSYLYAGEQFDSVLKQYYLRARYYDPTNGRFNQMDTFKGSNFDPQSLHKYDYCHGNPVNGTDPSGRNIVELVIILNALLVVGTILYTVHLFKAKKQAKYLLRTKTGAWFPGDAETIIEINRGVTTDSVVSQVQASGKFSAAYDEAMKVLAKKGEIREEDKNLPEAKGMAFMFAMVATSFAFDGPLTAAQASDRLQVLVDAYPEGSITLPGSSAKAGYDGFTHFYTAAFTTIFATGPGAKVLGEGNEIYSYFVPAAGHYEEEDLIVNDMGIAFAQSLFKNE
jgi:RHS repeat-associated protein